MTSNNSTTKIRTMADDLEKSKNGELKAVLPVSGVSAPARGTSPAQPLPSSSKEEKNKEEKKENKKSLGDVLSHLKQEYKGSEENKTEINKNDKSELKDLLGKIDKFAQKKPAAKSDIQTSRKEDAIQPDSFGALKKTEAEEKAALLRDQEKIKNEIAETERKLKEKIEEKNKILESKKTKKEASGVIGSGVKESEPEQSARKIGEKTKLAEGKTGPDLSKPYLSPESRLLFGKPEQYSSVSKKVKTKREGPEVSNIEKSLERPDLKKEDKKMNSEKEHRRFKKFMKGKYTAKIAEKKSKKIIFSLLILMVIAIAAVFVWFLVLDKRSPEQLSQPSQPTTSVAEIEKFSSIKNEIVIDLEKEDNNAIAKIIAQADQLEEDGELTDISRVIIKEGNFISLERLLEELKIEIPKDILIFFDDNKYSLLLFKEKTGVKRLGLAFVVDDPSATRLKFQAWENEPSENRKIYRAFESLFLGSRISVDPQVKFKTGEYSGVKMRYLQIPDQGTSLDYLIYDDILLVTTSKDSAFRVIEMLVD